MRKLIAGVFLFTLIVLTFSLCSNLFIKQSKWDKIAGANSFDIIKWEFENLFDKWTYKLKDALAQDSISEDEKIKLIERYIYVAQEADVLQEKVDRVKSEGAQSSSANETWEEKLIALVAERDGLKGQIEEIIESQVSAVLAEEGLSTTLKLSGNAEIIFPPVDFTFEARPNVLIVSPRDKIEVVDTTVLKFDINMEEILAMEAAVEAQGFSSLVEQVGAIATYPSMIPRHIALRNLLSRVAHEWAHHYLFFKPLGQKYWSDYEMRTINETVADIIGNEIGLLVYQRYYEVKEEEQVQSDGQTQTLFDFTGEMREIRLTVDGYLAAGEIEKAELYMEEKRLYLLENGYYIRKLNQAYFAFHGAYADTPASVSPVGGQVRELRAQSASFTDFMRKASGISSYDELLEIIGDKSTN